MAIVDIDATTLQNTSTQSLQRGDGTLQDLVAGRTYMISSLIAVD
jgi:hypothetical protein